MIERNEDEHLKCINVFIYAGLQFGFDLDANTFSEDL